MAYLVHVGRRVMFDSVVRVAAGWDWVSPLITFIQNWQRSPSVGFFLPYMYSLSAWEIARSLKIQGVDVWGVMVIGDEILLRVREAQADHTERCLQSMGLPFQCTASPNREKHMPPHWADKE